MPSVFLDPQGGIFWGAIAGIVFALAFFGVGVYRVVEFSGLGLNPTKRVVLTVGHVLGCLLFSSSIAVLGIDSKRELHQITGTLLFSGMLVLFPIHIYVGLKRRILLKKQQEK
jgi:hypothetical protein